MRMGKWQGRDEKGDGEKNLLSKQFLHTLQAQRQNAMHGATIYHRQLFNPCAYTH